MILSTLWLLTFNWNNGFGLAVEWWVYIAIVILWVLYVKFNKIGFILLVLLFFLNLHINHLFNINSLGLDFNFEKINITHPSYVGMIDKYRYDDLTLPYTLRYIFYSKWLMIFCWLDSTLGILSPIFWVRVLGLSGVALMILGLTKINPKSWWWLLVVCISSGLGILVDTKTAIILSLPVVVMAMAKGLDHNLFKKYWWTLLVLMVIDLILK